MQYYIHSFHSWRDTFLFALAAVLGAGCQSSRTESVVVEVAPAPAAVQTPAVTAASPSVTPAARTAIRINAGGTTGITNSMGGVWLPDQGFTGGATTSRAADLPIANTQDAAIYRTEHFGMTAFSRELPNGAYTVKLHFAETYDGVSAAGQRVFSFNVEGKEFADFDVFAKAGGARRAYVETVTANVADGKLDITFTSRVQNPAINGIEIIPR